MRLPFILLLVYLPPSLSVYTKFTQIVPFMALSGDFSAKNFSRKRKNVTKHSSVGDSTIQSTNNELFKISNGINAPKTKYAMYLG